MRNKRVHFFLVLVLLVFSENIFAQKQKAFFEIADKKIFFEFEEKVGVWRTISDSNINCVEKGPSNSQLKISTTYEHVPLSEFKTEYKEMFDEKGCVWTRTTNDVIRDDEENNFTYLTLLNDSSSFIVRPPSCYRHDTIMQINPITKQEEMVEQIDSVTKTKFNLGSVSKSQLFDAISNQFNLYKNGENIRVKYFWFFVVNDRCSFFEVNYLDYDNINSVKQKIANIPSGSRLVIERIKFEDTNERKFYGWFYDLASFKLVD